jgi:5-methyltetrahydropteroyltriglutamate--homocysteine methyltransferase
MFLRSATKLTGKITLPAPSTMHFSRCNDFADRAAYADVDAFFADLAAVFRQEIAELAKAGCRYVQLDEVAVALLCDPAIRDEIKRSGSEPDALVDLYIKSINDAVTERPSDVTVGVHMCRGNFKGHYLGAGGYESVAERSFADTRVNHFLLEYDTPRAGDFTPLRFVPKGKGVVLGIISSKTSALEPMDDLRRRVDLAAKHVGLERLAISPQCGFASSAGGNPLTEADQRAKLRLLVDAARAIWH